MGGSFKVALLRNGVEVSGSGYARATVTTPTAGTPETEIDNAVSISLSLKASFTASGGAIVYDQVQLYASDNTTLIGTSDYGSGITINSGVTDNVTLTFRIGESRDVGDGVGIQTMLTNQKSIGQNINLKGGETYVSSAPILSTYVAGGRVIGKGVTEPIAYTHPLSGLTSSVIFADEAKRSDATVPLWWHEGQDFGFEFLLFSGATRSQITAEVTKPGIGILVSGTSVGLGTGKLHLRKCNFSYFKVGLKLARTAPEANCDESVYTDVGFNRCDIGVQIVNYQGMGHHFFHPRFGLTPICFDFVSGGDVKCYGGLIAHNCVAFNFPGNPNNFGQNNAGYYWQGLKIDSQATGMKIVYQTPISGQGYYSNIVFDEVHFPSPQGADGTPLIHWGGTTASPSTLAPAAVISGSTCLTLNNALNLQRGMLVWDTAVGGTGRPRIIVENARIWYHTSSPITSVLDLCDLTKCRGKARVTFRNCFDYNTAAPFADYNGEVTGLLT